MKEMYTKPVAEMETFATTDVVTTSGAGAPTTPSREI